MVSVRTSILGDLDPYPDHSPPSGRYSLVCEEPLITWLSQV